MPAKLGKSAKLSQPAENAGWVAKMATGLCWQGFARQARTDYSGPPPLDAIAPGQRGEGAVAHVGYQNCCRGAEKDRG